MIHKIIRYVWNSIIFRTVLILVILFLLLIDYYGLSLFRGTVDYQRFGTVSDWFSNIATLITIVIAAVTIINERKIAEEDRKYQENNREAERQERQLEKDREGDLLSQALYIWPTGTTDIMTHRTTLDRMCFSNKTEVPIYKWRVKDTNGRIIATSDINGPIFPDIIQEVRIGESLSNKDDYTVEFNSFNGKTWARRGIDVKECNWE